MLITAALLVGALLLWLGPLPGRPGRPGRPGKAHGRRRRLPLPRRRGHPAEVDVWSLVVESVATAVRAGAAPTPACAACCRAALDLAPEVDAEVELLARTASAGGDLGAAWHEVAARVDDPGLRAVAAAWQLSETTGAPLADALDVAARLRRGEVERAARAKAALAAPTASVNLLTALPVCGAGLGMVLGADVIGVYASPLALVTVLPGLVLVAVGRLCCRRMVDHAGRIRSLA